MSALLGVGAAKNCDGCHALTRGRLSEWNDLTDEGEVACLTNLAPTTQAEAVQIVTCLRDELDNKWHPGRIGIDATAAGLAWFEYVFKLAHGARWAALFAEWKGRVATR